MAIKHYMVMGYGESGTGKTIDMALAFPGAVFIGNPRGPISAEKFDLRPMTLSTDRLKDLPKAIRELKVSPTAIVFDDLSLGTKKDVREGQLQQSLSNDKDAKNKYKVWVEIAADTMRAIETAESLKIPVAINAHVREPGTWDGVFTPGGPDLPGKQLAKLIPPSCDLNMHVVPQKDRPAWPFAYQTSYGVNQNDETGLLQEGASPYVVKSRLKNCPPIAPMNIGEILRHAGRDVPRLANGAWIESVVEKLATRFKDLPFEERRAMFVSHIPGLQSKYNATKAQLAWTLRDAIDRADLRAMTVDLLAGFGIEL